MADKKTAYVLTDEDLVKLKETMSYVESLRRNKPIRNDDSFNSLSPDVYVALVPFGGIDGITPVDIPTGTGTGGSLGSPSSVSCDIYQIIPGESVGGSTQFMPVSDTSLDVYNISTQAIPGNSWVVVTRDKYGVWIATGVIGSSSGIGGTWLTLSPVTDVSLTCTAGTVSITVTKDTGHDFYVRNTP